jgi:hypothetical protein
MRFFIKPCDTAANSMNDSANIGDVAEGLMTALNHRKPLVSGLDGQGAQMVLIVKMTLVITVVSNRNFTPHSLTH